VYGGGGVIGVGREERVIDIERGEEAAVCVLSVDASDDCD